jgi:hypothetical protein
MDLQKADGSQYPLVSEFTFLFNDTLVATDGVKKAFNTAMIAEMIELPPGAVIIGGEVAVETADAASTTWTLSLGDAASATRYANAVNLKAAARTALTLSGFRVTGPVRATIAVSGTAPTAGKVTVRTEHVLPGRVNELS